jgi:ABC-type multidrug transport system ATPase subunit
MLKELLISLKKEKIAILVNSHAAGILEDVCDRVCVMNKGKIVLSDSLANLLKTSKIKVVADFADSATASEFAGKQAPISFALKMPTVVEFVLDDANRCNELAGAIMAAGGKLIEVSPVMLTLDQLFVRVLSEQQQAKTGENA